ncbi:MAG: hypothetical protein FWD73_08535 [Polyangiaceae bacterium]|nr:hypothetical protein [Polyangiaceae bacterium]
MTRWFQSRVRGRPARGVVSVEYSLLLVAVAIPAVAGLVEGGRRMYTEYQFVRNTILLPTP